MCILYTRYNGLRCSTGVRIEADRGSLGTCYMSFDYVTSLTSIERISLRAFARVSLKIFFLLAKILVN